MTPACSRSDSTIEPIWYNDVRLYCSLRQNQKSKPIIYSTDDYSAVVNGTSWLQKVCNFRYGSTILINSPKLVSYAISFPWLYYSIGNQYWIILFSSSFDVIFQLYPADILLKKQTSFHETCEKPWVFFGQCFLPSIVMISSKTCPFLYL